jgi:ornithine carbamoyltransferase
LEGGFILIATTIPPGVSPYIHPSVTGRDLTSIQDFLPEDLACALKLAAAVKMRPSDYRGTLAGKQIVLFFEKPSLRTRLTFEAGINSLGGVSFFVDQTQSRLGARESLSDVAHNLERWVDGIVLRTFAHETVTTMAEHASIPVINALSDLEHPCQALADMLTLQEHFGDLRNVHLAYVGDGNNMAHSLMLAAVSLGASISVATPEGYEPNPDITAAARALTAISGGGVEVVNDPLDAVAGADAVYTDVRASMGQESEAADRREIFAPYQVNQNLFSCAARHAVFMHCLPAHRGDEVTEAVIDSPRSVVFDQAENRLHIQKAILVLLLEGGVHRFPPRSHHA